MNTNDDHRRDSAAAASISRSRRRRGGVTRKSRNQRQRNRSVTPSPRAAVTRLRPQSVTHPTPTRPTGTDSKCDPARTRREILLELIGAAIESEEING
jgi:hypothetical protein